MSSLLILAAGGHAKVVAETAIASGVAARILFLDDAPLSSVLGMPVVGPLDLAFDPLIREQFPAAFVAMGHSANRLDWISRLQKAGYILPQLIHPTAWISPSATIGSGSVVMAQAVVQSEVIVGNGAIINTGSSVDHGSHLSDGVHICPGAHLAGDVSVGSRSWIGIGSSVIQQIRIGSDVVVGAGASVVSDLPNGVTAMGVPARVLP